MATKGTEQYRIWLEKFNAAKAAKAAGTVVEKQKASSHPYSYYAKAGICPKDKSYRIWLKAASKATHSATKECPFIAVLTCYKQIVNA